MLFDARLLKDYRRILRCTSCRFLYSSIRLKSVITEYLLFDAIIHWQLIYAAEATLS